MGVDLALLPFESDFFSHTILNFPRCSRFFETFRQETETPVPDRFNTYLSRDDKYEEPHYGNTSTTPYGTPLGWIRAATVSKLVALHMVDCIYCGNSEQFNAVAAYISQLDLNTRVALYWH